MDKEKKKTRFVYQPEYPGGPKEFTKFLYSNLRYPKDALTNKIEGVVYMAVPYTHLTLPTNREV